LKECVLFQYTQLLNFPGDVLVNDLQMPQTFSTFIAFSWNVLLPIGLLMLSVIQYRVSNSRVFFQWLLLATVDPKNRWQASNWISTHCTVHCYNSNLPVLEQGTTRYIGCKICEGFAHGKLLIFCFAFQRIQLLYRPSMNNDIRR
jgi:hypothetical protein